MQNDHGPVAGRQARQALGLIVAAPACGTSTEDTQADDTQDTDPNDDDGTDPTDDNPDAAKKYGVMTIPSVKLFKNGEVIDEFVGAQPEEKIKQWLDQKL